MSRTTNKEQHMAALSINDFKSLLRGGGARPSLFKVVMPFPIFTGAGNSSEQLEFLCKAAALPASTLGAIIVPFRGRQLKIAGYDGTTTTSWIQGDSDGNVEVSTKMNPSLTTTGKALVLGF